MDSLLVYAFLCNELLNLSSDPVDKLASNGRQLSLLLQGTEWVSNGSAKWILRRRRSLSLLTKDRARVDTAIATNVGKQVKRLFCDLGNSSVAVSTISLGNIDR